MMALYLVVEGVVVAVAVTLAVLGARAAKRQRVDIEKYWRERGRRP